MQRFKRFARVTDASRSELSHPCATICDTMTPEAISRRRFLAAGTAVLATRLSKAQTAVTSIRAGDVVDRIRAHVGMPWLSATMPTTVDNIVGGDANTKVYGIATTTMATLEVLESAVKSGKNMVISHETPYYFHPDKTDDIKGDATLSYKLEYIRKNNIAIFHMHDHWHHRQPDGIATGMVKEMSWQKYVDPDDNKKFTFPDETLEVFSRGLQEKLQLRARFGVIGRPSMQVPRSICELGLCKTRTGGLKKLLVAP